MGLIQSLLAEKDEAEAPVAAVESTSPSGEPAAANASASSGSPPPEPKVAFEADAASAAEAAKKFAGQIRTELEKTASEGGSGEGGELAKTLAKCAHYITELLEERKAHEKYAQAILDEAAEAEGLRRYREAVKLACELVAQGKIEPPDDYDMHKIAEDLMKEDLRVVRKAAEFAGAARLGNLGQVPDKDTRNGAAEDGTRVRDDDRSFLDAHAFLLGR